jgi:MFS transporter, DHA1 family, multidrug resistance protein
MLFMLRRESLWIPVILLVILIGCWSELDLYAPSFPQMMHHFGTTEQMMQWTLSLNFLGFFLASLLCGPLADAFGRRPVILGGSAIFVVGSFICLWATSIEIMLLGRLIQGIGVSAPVTVCQAVIADIYQGEKQIRLLSRTNSAITVTMALAPIVGVYLTEHFGWHANFVAIFAVALLGGALIFLFVPETHEQHARSTFKPSTLISGYITLLKNKDFMSAALGMCFVVTPYFVLIGILPLLFMEQLGVSIGNYAFYQGSIVGLFSALSLSIPWILSSFDINKVARLSTIASVLSLAVSFVLSFIVPDNPLLITALMWVYVLGIVVPSTVMFVRAMDMFDHLRACASSMIQSLRMLSMAAGTALAGAMYDGSFRPVVFVMLVFMLLSVPMLVMVFRKHGIINATKPIQAMH